MKTSIAALSISLAAFALPAAAQPTKAGVLWGHTEAGDQTQNAARLGPLSVQAARRRRRSGEHWHGHPRGPVHLRRPTL